MSRNRKRTINQILVTDKVIMTPEFKKKKKIYKFNFFLSSFLACTLFACCVYGEYDRNKSESVSQDILLGLEIKDVDDTTVSVKDGIVVIKEVSENDANSQSPTIVDISNLGIENDKTQIARSIAPDGKSYYTEAVLKIPRLGIEYPVLSDTSDELLKISLNKFWGPDPNEIGNYVIAGHNYRNGKMFGKLPGIQIGDTCELTDLSGRTITYKVYTRYNVTEDDVRCTSQITNGKKEITLITCINGGKQRLIVKAEKV